MSTMNNLTSGGDEHESEAPPPLIIPSQQQYRTTVMATIQQQQQQSQHQRCNVVPHRPTNEKNELSQSNPVGEIDRPEFSLQRLRNRRGSSPSALQRPLKSVKEHHSPPPKLNDHSLNDDKKGRSTESRSIHPTASRLLQQSTSSSLLTSSQNVVPQQHQPHNTGMTRLRDFQPSYSSGSLLGQSTTSTHHTNIEYSLPPKDGFSQNSSHNIIPKQHSSISPTASSTNKARRSRSLGRCSTFNDSKQPQRSPVQVKREEIDPHDVIKIEQEDCVSGPSLTQLLEVATKAGQSQERSPQNSQRRETLESRTLRNSDKTSPQSKRVKGEIKELKVGMRPNQPRSPTEHSPSSTSPSLHGTIRKKVTRFHSQPRSMVSVDNKKLPSPKSQMRATKKIQTSNNCGIGHNKLITDTMVATTTASSDGCDENHHVANIERSTSSSSSLSNAISDRNQGLQRNKHVTGMAMSQECLPTTSSGFNDIDDGMTTMMTQGSDDPLYASRRRLGRSFSVSQTVIPMEVDGQHRFQRQTSFLKRQEEYSKRQQHRSDDDIALNIRKSAAGDRLQSKSSRDYQPGQHRRPYNEIGSIDRSERRRSASRPAAMHSHLRCVRKSSGGSFDENGEDEGVPMLALKDRLVSELKNYSSDMDKQTLIKYFKHENQLLNLMNPRLLNSSLERRKGSNEIADLLTGNEGNATTNESVSPPQTVLCEHCSRLTFDNLGLKEELTRESRRSAVVAAHRERQEIQMEDAKELLFALVNECDDFPTWLTKELYHVISVLNGGVTSLSPEYHDVRKTRQPVLSTSLVSPSSRSPSMANLHLINGRTARASLTRQQLRHPSVDGPIRLPAPLTPFLQLDNWIQEQQSLQTSSVSARQRYGTIDSGRRPGSSRTSRSLYDDNNDNVQHNLIEGTTGTNHVATKSRPRSGPTATRPPLQSPPARSASVTSFGRSKIKERFDSGTVRSVKEEGNVEHKEYLKEEVERHDEVMSQNSCSDSDTMDGDDVATEESQSLSSLRNTYPLENEKTLTESGDPPHQKAPNMGSDNLSATDGEIHKQQRRRLRPMIPPLGLKQVGRGSWLSGAQTQGDTYGGGT